jgi:hypothetical protein
MSEEMNNTESMVNIGLSTEELQLLKARLAEEKLQKELVQKKAHLMQDEGFKMLYENSPSFKSAIDQKPAYLNNPDALELLIGKSKQELLPKEEVRQPLPHSSDPMYQRTSQPLETERKDERQIADLSVKEIEKLMHEGGMPQHQIESNAFMMNMLHKTASQNRRKQ